MGFRSTFVTNHRSFNFPDWFVKKWKNDVLFGENTVIASKCEGKTYDNWLDLETDLKKMLVEWNNLDQLILVYVHECEGITKLVITKNGIRYIEPTAWKYVDQVTHFYSCDCNAEN